MSITSQYDAAQNTLKISISGRFTYDLHEPFTDAYKNAPGSMQRQYVIDVSKVEYMDSAALGLLLVLRERAGGDASKITITGAKNTVKGILDIARFEDMFTIR